MDSVSNQVTGQIIIIDKPYDWTSFDVIKKIRGVLKIKKIGHAGTLDPLATGLLILCTGSKTKKINYFQGLEKEYTGSFLLGQTTASIDLETPVIKKLDIRNIHPDRVRKSAKKLEGNIHQVPPDYSAIKVAGTRVYHHARRGEKVELRSRQVEVREFRITRLNLPEVHFLVACSKGTYIRSLVRDLGDDLGVGAVLTSLRRTRIGEFTLAQAQPLSEFLKEKGHDPVTKERPPRFLRTKPG